MQGGFDSQMSAEKRKYVELEIEHKKLQDMIMKLEDDHETKSNDDDNVMKSVLDKLDGEFTNFKENYNQEKLQEIMNETPEKLLDKQSSLNKELVIYKQCIDEIIISSKSFGKYIQDIDGIIDKLSSPDLANYQQWNVDTILIWIQGLENGRFMKYIDLLRNGFNESEIKGSDLPELTRGDLTLPPFNMKSFRDKRFRKSFKSLNSPGPQLMMNQLRWLMKEHPLHLLGR